MTKIIIEIIKKCYARDKTAAAAAATTERGCCTRTEPVRDRYTECVTKKGTTYYLPATAAKGLTGRGRGKKLKKLKYSYMG